MIVCQMQPVTLKKKCVTIGNSRGFIIDKKKIRLHSKWKYVIKVIPEFKQEEDENNAHATSRDRASDREATEGRG